ncbi:MAG: hypothetical protein WD906_06125 [Anaerolineales bacterium]
MPGVIDPETMAVGGVPTLWWPVQIELTEAERLEEIERQTLAGLLWAAPVPEAVLRLLLGETDVVRAIDPPGGFDPEAQGEWDPERATFVFRRPLHLEADREEDSSRVLEYALEGAGHWRMVISAEQFSVSRI